MKVLSKKRGFFSNYFSKFSKLINGGVLIRPGGCPDFRKINKRGGPLIRDLRVQPRQQSRPGG